MVAIDLGACSVCGARMALVTRWATDTQTSGFEQMWRECSERGHGSGHDAETVGEPFDVGMSAWLEVGRRGGW
jgi:hypothetical protein